MNAADRIMDWILFGREEDKEAIQELFPIEDCQCDLCKHDRTGAPY